MTRTDVEFSSQGDTCAAWLYSVPVDAVSAPIIVMAHGLTGTRRDRLGAFAERFADAGIAALVFDYRGFGDSSGEADLFDPERQFEDWRAAIAFARSIPGVDPDRVATFGSSLGGGNALHAAAEDPRVAAAISQVPFLDLANQAYSGHPETFDRMLDTARAGGYLPAVGQPDEAAFIRAPDAEKGWRHVVAIGEDSRWRNRCSASWLLSEYRPITDAATLHCPWLVCVGADDQVALPAPAIDAARAAPFGELRLYPGVDHFDIYDGPAHEAVVADQLGFLRRHLLLANTDTGNHPSERTAPARRRNDENGHRSYIEQNKTIATRWFTEFWGANFNPSVIDELAASDIRFEYSMHASRRGRHEVRTYIEAFRAAFPDLSFEPTAELIADGDWIVGQWFGGGTHTGAAFDDLPVGALPAATGKTIRFGGTTVLKIEDGLIVEETGLDDGVAALTQLGLIPSP